MKWLALPFFLLGVVVFRSIYDRLVGLALHPLMAWLAKGVKAPGASLL